MAEVQIGRQGAQPVAFASAGKLSVSPAAPGTPAAELRTFSASFDAGGLARRTPGLLSASAGWAPAVHRARLRDEPRVAIIHYWLVRMRGGERVLERLLRLFPRADVFTHVYDPKGVSEVIRERVAGTTFIQKLPASKRLYQKYLPLMPLALEQLDLRGYDLILSCEAGPAKGVIAPPGALHVCYCHSPMRYLWDHYNDYLQSAGRLSRLGIPILTHMLREWDCVSAARVDRIIANSGFIQQRIEKAWRRPSTVVHPPVEVSAYRPSDELDGHYLWVGQTTPYKRADLAVEAFNDLGLPLLMIGDGAMLADLKRRARPNVKIVPRVSYDDLRRAYARCRALVFTAEEDFGIIPVEALASGRPVLAYGGGGALETVTPGVTGLFFREQTKESLIAGVEAMEAWLRHFDPAAAVRSAARFTPERFDEGVLSVIRA
ncbi:glycosyltransferase [Phenylobacterium sp. LjRoot219]|uniref:glycosyltransferase n=1 Tax=Phenylobacterium sp. LjRoot219 TaxID=3342283 RepID=UPI003ECFB85C